MAIDADTIVAPDSIERFHGVMADTQHRRRLRLRRPAPRQLGVGARPLRRVPAGVQLLQADPGSLRQAVDRVRLLLDLPHRGAARARRLADADDGRGHGPDLDDVPAPGRRCASCRTRSAIRSSRTTSHFMRKQLRRWSHGFMQNVQLHWSRLLPIGFLRSVVGVAFWESTVASIIYLGVVPLTGALVSESADSAGLHPRRAGADGAGAHAGGARSEFWRALGSIPSFFVLRVVNCLFVLEAIWSE